MAAVERIAAEAIEVARGSRRRGPTSPLDNFPPADFHESKFAFNRSRSDA